MIDLTTRRTIRRMSGENWSTREIADATGVSQSSVVNVLKDEGEGDLRKRADRFEYLSHGGSSGCYENGNIMLTEEQLHANDPLAELIALETLMEKIDGLKSND